MDDRRVVLFLCTANYYRSRFAEAVFNHAAARAGLPWRAESAGLAAACESRNPGVLSPYTRAALAALGIPLLEPVRAPRDAGATHFEAAARVIALKAEEHRPLVLQRFPAWAARVEYWHVHDLDRAGPEEALPTLEGLVRALVRELSDAQELAGYANVSAR